MPSEVLRTLQRWNSLLTHLPGVVFELDLEGRYTRVEGRLLDDLGVTEQDFIGLRVDEPYVDDPLVAAALNRVLSGEVAAASFLVNQYGRWWDVHLAALLDADNRIESITGIALDISDKLAAAAAQRASDVKSKFLAAMSHELRTPLNSVLGFAELLAMAETRPKELRYLGNISQSGRHLLHLVNDLLDLAKIEAGKLKIEMRPLTVAGAVANCIESMQPIAEAKGLALRSRVSPDLLVQADPTLLDQVLLNLLSNAVKFTAVGSVSVRASRRGLGTIRISVVDTGPGVSEEDQAEIWSEFAQLGLPGERHAGTGLGLPLAKRLAELMGGKLKMQSRLGAGSVFSLDLAAAAAS